MNREFIETKEFTDLWNKLNLTDDDLRRLQQEILSNPNIGAIMEETGGVRKMRFALPNQGKSGSIRIIFIDFIVQEHIYLLTAFTKSKQSNLNQSQRNMMKKVVTKIKEAEDRKMKQKANENYVTEEEFELEDEIEYTDYDQSAFDDFDMFESIMRGLNQALEYAESHNSVIENIKLRINENEPTKY